MASLRVDGAPAVQFPACDGLELASLTVESASGDLIWSITAPTPLPAQRQYILGADVPGYSTQGEWSDARTEYEVTITANGPDFELYTEVRFEDVDASGLFIGGEPATQKDLDGQLGCSR